MSERKSWDIAPKSARKTAKPAAAPVRTRASGAQDIVRRAPRKEAPAPVRRVRTNDVTLARGARTRHEPQESIKERRARVRKAGMLVMSIVGVVVAGGFMALTWQQGLRVQAVSAQGVHAESVEHIARAQMQGTLGYVIPRNSFFFVPQKDIRQEILKTHPAIESVSIRADGLQRITITTSPRTEAFVWCGATYVAGYASCYSANAEGLIFAPSAPEAATQGVLRFYGALEGDALNPIGVYMANKDHISDALRFIKTIQALGPAISVYVFRGDESDLMTRAGSRITYVTGREQEAFETARNALSNLSLNDGSIEYVDLRFPGRAYFKRSEPGKAEEMSSATTTQEKTEVAE